MAHSYRNDPDIPDFDDGKWILVMDAECALCSTAARRIARLDRDDRVRIAPVQTALGAALLRHYGMDPDDPQSWLFLRDGTAYTSLKAITALFPALSAWYVPLKLLEALPGRVQDWCYNSLARNRYRLFGRGDMCAMPDAALQARLLR